MQSPTALLRTALSDPSFTQQATAKLTLICRDAEVSTCRTIVANLKAVIKHSSTDVQTKLTALEILHCCAQSGSLNFFSALGNKFIKRLAILASHRLGSDDPERGKDLFGKQSLSSEQSQRASVLFLQKLLRYFVCWASSVEGSSNRGAARIKRSYDELARRGLKFPQQDTELSEALMEHMAKCYRAISRFYSLIDRDSQDQPRVEKYAAKIISFKAQIESEVARLIGEKGNSSDLEVLVRTNDDLTEAVQRYNEFKSHKENPSPIRSRRQPSSIDLVNLLDTPYLESPAKLPEAAYLEEFMELSIQDCEEAPPSSLRNPEPQSKGRLRSSPLSPHSRRMQEAKLNEKYSDLAYFEVKLNSDFTTMFESGKGSLEEEYGQLVNCT